MKALLCNLLAVAMAGAAAAGESASPPLGDALERLREHHRVPGVVAIVVDQNGIREVVALGHADLASRRPMTADTLVRIGSITKTFNAIGLLQLEARGLLSLQAPLHSVAPDAPLENPWQDSHPVRLVHLVEHTAGLADLNRTEFDHNQPLPSLLAAIEFNGKPRRLRWPAGLYAEYSNVGAGYLGLVMERVGGQPYAAFIRDQVLVPLGLTSATLTADDQTLDRLATGYDSDGQTVIPYWHMLFPPLGAINATPREMAALPQLFLRRGQPGATLIDAAAIDRMETPTSSLAARAGLTFGYGLGIDQEIDGDYLWYGHGGDGDGYLSHFSYQKELGVGFFLTFNAFKRDALKAFKHAIRQHLSDPRQSRRAIPQAPDTNPAKAYVGVYGKLTQRFEWQNERPQMTVTLEDDRLFLTYADGQRLPLIAVGRGLYRHPVDPVATLAFVEYDGRWTLHGEFGGFGKRE